MDLRTATDEALMEALQQRDVESLSELYDRHHRTAFALAYRALGDRGLAEDVLQDTFLAVWRQAGSYRPERGTVRAWLFSIVRHRAIDMARKRQNTNGDVPLDRHEYSLDYPDAWDEVSQNLDRQRVLQAMALLPPEQREALSLSYFSGYTCQEIAMQTGAPLGTVKGRMRLGLQKLRTVLADGVQGGSH